MQNNNSQFSILNSQLFNRVYEGKTVLVTGHTGFKGSWLSFWLSQMGAKVIGYSLEAPTNPNHIGLLTSQFSILNSHLINIIGDIRDLEKLNQTFETYKPEIVFHLAAQPLVRYSYQNPVETFEVNTMGTINVFEACKKCDSVKAIVNITSDKCYENKEQKNGYNETDPMGGYDPYSASKGCSELITSSYRNSFFKDKGILLASCRAGNVIGGGDWAKDRLMSDIMLSVSQGKKVSIRNPNATRPWQHVLESLSGYLHIGQKLLEKKQEFAEAWNFGPSDERSITVEEVVKNVKKHWNKIDYEINIDPHQPHEANLLKLDCSKAHILLKWKDVWDGETTFEKTVKWYKAYYENDKMVLTQEDLENYVHDAKAKNIEWSK